MSISFCSFGLSSSFLLGDCLLTKCAHYANCVPQRDGTAFCSCSLLCSSSFLPVCGSNSRTYWNECFLRREACFMQQNTSVASIKRCSKFSYIPLVTSSNDSSTKCFLLSRCKIILSYTSLVPVYFVSSLDVHKVQKSNSIWFDWWPLFFFNETSVVSFILLRSYCIWKFSKVCQFLIHFAVSSLSKFSFFCLFSLLFTFTRTNSLFWSQMPLLRHLSA